LPTNLKSQFSFHVLNPRISKSWFEFQPVLNPRISKSQFSFPTVLNPRISKSCILISNWYICVQIAQTKSQCLNAVGMTFMCSDKSNEANVNINKNKSECTEITDKKQIEILNQSVENKINVKLTEDKHPPKILQNQLNENSKYSKMIFGSYLEKLPFYFAIKRRYIWLLILVCLSPRAYEYRHTNVLHIGARACGQCLNFDCALLLGLILRRTITRIRNSSLGVIFPCDRHIHFHKMAGWTVFFFSILHTIFHLANF
ncbi:NADPH oxidase 5, partial [Armadillidium vulgare]